MDYIDLNDTPGSYGGKKGKAAQVTPTEDGMEWSETTIDDHSARHENGGADEINVAGLSGELADEQKSNWSKVSGKPTEFTPEAHTCKD